MNFASDNTVGVHPAILEAIAGANAGPQPSYGADPFTAQAKDRLCELFERDVEVFLVLTGTAANALALSAICPPHGAVLCHADAHVRVDEGGAPQLFTGGARIVGISGAGCKLTPALVTGKLNGFVRGDRDQKPAALSITQATELGTVYRPDEIAALAEAAHGNGMRLHMDGARFANAVAGLGVAPAAITWKAGVDVLSFGATKNGALALEAVVFFDTALAEDFSRRRLRAGQVLSKGRFLGAQMLAYLDDGRWLANAAHANAMATRLAAGLAGLDTVRLPLPVEANEVFPIMPKAMVEALGKAGVVFYPWPGEGPGTDAIADDETLARFVTSFATAPEDVDRLADLVRSLDR